MSTRSHSFARLLGARITSLRSEQGLTQEKLAWEAGLSSKGYLSRIERGERVPSLVVAEQLARRLGVEIRDLFIHPSRSEVDRAMEHLRRGGPVMARAALTMLEGQHTYPPESRRPPAMAGEREPDEEPGDDDHKGRK